MRLSCVILLVALVGCHSDPPDSMTAAILAALMAADALAPQRGKAGRAYSYYVKKRIQWLVGETTSLGLPPFTELKARIGGEIDAVAQYLEAKLGAIDAPGPLGGATDTTIPGHVDLADVAKIYGDDDAPTIDTRKTRYVADRRDRVQRIVWRAAAVHHELWTGSDALTAANLNSAAVDVLLDRRLRIIERMIYTDSAQGDRPNGTWTIAGAQGGWVDGRRVVLTEYPFVHASPAFLAGLAAAGLDITMLPDFTAEGTAPHQLLRYNKANSRIRPPAAPHWKKNNPTDYGWVLAPQGGTTPAAVFDLFLPGTSPVDPAFVDFWSRNWLFCDHMMAALHVDALRFGLRRWHGSDDAFNTAAGHGVSLSVPVPSSGNPDPTDLMSDGNAFFEGVAIKPSELQVGDHLIFWNSYFARAIVRTDFGLENSLITAIDGEDGKSSKLVGHGELELDYTAFAEELLSILTDAFTGVRSAIVHRLAADPTLDYFDFPRYPFAIIQWSPYGEGFHAADANQLQAPGAWWMRIQLKDTKTGSAGALSLSQALVLFPKSVAFRPGKHTPPADCPGHDSDYQESVYLPLSYPKGVKGHWPQYFTDRESGAETDPDVALQDAKIDANWAPGFFHDGPGSKIPVLRPKAVLS